MVLASALVVRLRTHGLVDLLVALTAGGGGLAALVLLGHVGRLVRMSGTLLFRGNGIERVDVLVVFLWLRMVK